MNQHTAQRQSETSNDFISWTSELIQLCQDKTNVQFITQHAALSEASKDFGNLASGQCLALTFPSNTEEGKALINFANEHTLNYVIRGKGLSQGGQTLNLQGSVTLDSSQMTAVRAPNLEKKTIQCQGGASWRSLVAASVPHGLVPKVMPFFPDLTVGGVVSIGGIGGNSHYLGCAAGNIQEMEVITGHGEIIICSPHQNEDLFEATLCGLGRCSLITSLTVSLREFKPHVKTFYLHYADYKSWLHAQKYFVEKKVDYLEAFCSPLFLGLHTSGNQWSPLTHWFYSLQVSVEYEGEEPTDTALGNHKALQIIKTGCAETTSFLTRYGVRAENLKKSGNWSLAHPWWEIMLPFDTFSEIFPELLNKLPILLGDGLGYRIFALDQNCPLSFMKSCEGLAMGFAVLPGGIDPKNLPQVLQAFQDINEWLYPLGAKRYLSGWLGEMSEEDWRRHYGDYYSTWKGAKEKYDPNNIFQSHLLNGAL